MTAAPTSTDAQGPPLHALVLAAGASRRFGGVKALALIDGKPMLQWTIDALTEAGVDGLSIVLGAHAAEIIPQINTRGATLVSHEDWTHGMSASLRAGLATVNAHNAGLLIALADQPDIGVDDYRRLIAAWRAEPDRPASMSPPRTPTRTQPTSATPTHPATAHSTWGLKLTTAGTHTPQTGRNQRRKN